MKGTNLERNMAYDYIVLVSKKTNLGKWGLSRQIDIKYTYICSHSESSQGHIGVTCDNLYDSF